MDDDDDMMDDTYDFEYEDADEEEGEAGTENKYYTAKISRQDDPETAIKDFESIVADEAEPGEWGFKALKQLTKLTFRRKQFDRSLGYYMKLLPFTKKAVTRNVAEKAINGILDYVSANTEIDTALMQRFYEETLRSLAEAKNDRLSVKTNLKLAKLWLDRKEYARLSKLIRELHASIAPTAADEASGEGPDNTKGTMLLEIYALEIQMYGETKNNKKLREIYHQTLHVRSAIPHPKIMGIIRECGGKMHMSEKEWERAQVDFFEAFRNYDEAGSSQRTQVLKYLVLAHMLMGSKINPFDSQEIKPYRNDPQIMAMTNLVAAYQENNVHEAEKIIRENRATIMGDPFIQSHLADVLRSLRTQWIVDIIRPYTRVDLDYLASSLGISKEDVEDIVVSLILDRKVSGRIDQVQGQLELDQHKRLDERRYTALERWTEELGKMRKNIVAKASQVGGSQITGTMGMGFGFTERLAGLAEVPSTAWA